MATLKGEGALKEVNLIGEIHKNGVIFNEKGNPESGRKGAWITFQVDQSYAGLKNPSLKGDNPEKPSNFSIVSLLNIVISFLITKILAIYSHFNSKLHICNEIMIKRNCSAFMLSAGPLFMIFQNRF